MQLAVIVGGLVVADGGVAASHARLVRRGTDRLSARGVGLARLVRCASCLPSHRRGGRDGRWLVGAAIGLVAVRRRPASSCVAARWDRSRARGREVRRRPTSRCGAALVLSLLVSVPGEELFWRGLAQRTARGHDRSARAVAAVAWLGLRRRRTPRAEPADHRRRGRGRRRLGRARVVVRRRARAPLASHVLWTGLMLARPPTRARSQGRGGVSFLSTAVQDGPRGRARSARSRPRRRAVRTARRSCSRTAAGASGSPRPGARSRRGPGARIRRSPASCGTATSR